jgi:hypothetical protein
MNEEDYKIIDPLEFQFHYIILCAKLSLQLWHFSTW